MFSFLDKHKKTNKYNKRKKEMNGVLNDINILLIVILLTLV